jgi:hypothetical protein
MGPLSGPEIRKFSQERPQKTGGFTPDDDRLSAAVFSRWIWCLHRDEPP